MIDIFGHHAWTDPVYAAGQRTAIFNRLANPAGGGGTMPLLNMATLTPTQYATMERWKNDNFTRDWAGPPPPDPISPEGLDAAALTAASAPPSSRHRGRRHRRRADRRPREYVGAADPLRLDAALAAGAMSEFMALPWQADF